VVVCLEQGADLHMTQLMPLPLTVSCFSKIRIGFTFLVPAHLGSPGKRAIKWGVCVTICLSGTVSEILALISQNFKRLHTLNAPPILQNFNMCNANTLCIQFANQISNVWFHPLQRYGLGPKM